MSGRGGLRGALAVWLALLALLYLGLPFPAYETATLLPVRTVQLARGSDGRLLLRTEAGDGTGADWRSAVQELRTNAPGTVLLDTAEQLVLCGETELPPDVFDALRPAVQVRRAETLRPVEGLAELLHAHESGVTLAELTAEREAEKGRLAPLFKACFD